MLSERRDISEVKTKMGEAKSGPAFNTADALGRLMNNKKLYQKLLDKFVAGYSDYDEKISKVSAEKNFDEGAHLAHTMKGLAGNLGAENLQDASKDLEMLFKAQDASADFGPATEAFIAELHKALDEVKAGINLD